MPQAEREEVFPVSKDKLFDIITRYEDYPQFLSEVDRIEVERKGPGTTRAVYHISVIKSFTYTIELKEDREAGTVSWSLVESDLFKTNNGLWTLEPQGENETKVTYSLDVDFKIPVPGLIMRKLVKGNLPSMMKSFRERAQKV